VNRTVFLLPGLTCDRAVWARQIQGLDTTAEVRVPDFRGFDSLQAMAASVLADAPERFSVAGFSMGGRVAMELFRLAGGRVRRLALLDTGAHPVREGERAQRQAFLDVARAEGMGTLAAAWIPGMVHPDRLADAELVADITAMVQRFSLEEFEGQIRALLERPDARKLLPHIHCPTLVACGRQDAWAPLAQHEEITALLPDARLEIIEDSGHMSTMEQPGRVTELLRHWLRQPEA